MNTMKQDASLFAIQMTNAMSKKDQNVGWIKMVRAAALNYAKLMMNVTTQVSLNAE